MSVQTTSFAALIAPISEVTFFHDYWDQKPFRLSGRSPEIYGDVLHQADVDALLSRGDLRYPALRMAKDGPTVLPSSYSSILKFGSYASEGLIDVKRVRELYHAGATIILQMTRLSIPRIARFANALQAHLGFNVETTVYLTPPRAQGFTTHYDTHSVFILQVEGRKRWRLYNFMRHLPTLTETFDTCSTLPGAMTSEVVLEPGDLLYIPRGLAHDAVATEESPSLHVSVGLFPPMCSDLLGELVNELKADVRFRRSPLNTAFLKSREVDTAAQEINALLQTARERFDIRRLSTRHAERAARELTQSNAGRLQDTMALSGITLETIVARRADIVCVRQTKADCTKIKFYEKELTFPVAVTPAIDCVFERQQFAVKDIQKNLADSGKLVLVRRLLTEGLLRIVNPTVVS